MVFKIPPSKSKPQMASTVDYKSWSFRPCQPSRTKIIPPKVHSAPPVFIRDFYNENDSYYDYYDEYFFPYHDYYDENDEEEDDYDILSYGESSLCWEPDEFYASDGYTTELTEEEEFEEDYYSTDDDYYY